MPAAEPGQFEPFVDLNGINADAAGVDLGGQLPFWATGFADIAIVHNGHCTLVVEMGMSILRRWLSVSRPSRMTNSR